MTNASVNIDIFCKECQAKTEMVIDHVAGDVICRRCGIVQVERFLDEGQDWRTFSSDGTDWGAKVDSKDRTAGENNPLFDDIGTSIVDGSSTMAQNLQNAQRRTQNTAASGKSDATLGRIRNDLRDVAKLLNLSEQIINDCEWALKRRINDGKLKRATRAFYCAVMYWACLDAGETRTIGEIAHTCHLPDCKEEDFKKEVAKVVKRMFKERNASSGATRQETPQTNPQLHIVPLLTRACARLQISTEVERPTVHLVEMAYCFNLGKSTEPYVTAAAALLVIAWLYDVEHKPWFCEVAAAARVSAGAVKKCYQEILPHLGKRHKDDGRGLLPQDFQIRLKGGLEALPPPNAVNPCEQRLVSSAASSAAS
eukprot:gnl/MRDRNA2_/MRDRNA2_106607_c0_seq1.p1 gnl/MRDRNA2_/MRDRNA2_106607_c0~~gnl/MRDRNA2_/MRDRNA2_106607_c0_seq1.p1  ORF type:complete len:382 (-),score=60.17 gnl/MRDRNA2_/MRDRNA2_106607_c0_seq1:26-1129(-)